MECRSMLKRTWRASACVQAAGESKPMTTRIFECQSRRRPRVSFAPPSTSRRVRPSANDGVGYALLVALVLGPLAGAAEPPGGCLVAPLSALALPALSVLRPAC